MKKTLIITLILQLILIFPFTVMAYQDTDSAVTQETAAENPGQGELIDDAMIELITENRGNLFPVSSIKYWYTLPVDAYLTTAGEDSVVRVIIENGRQEVVIFVNKDGIHDHIGSVNIDSEYPDNFEINVDVIVNDAYPKQQSGCFIGFSDPFAAASESPFAAALLFDGQTAGIYSKEAENDSGIFTPLMETKSNEVKMSFVHLFAHTMVFINDKYAGQLHDGKEGPLCMIYGAMTLKDGDTANCSFDNLTIKKIW